MDSLCNHLSSIIHSYFDEAKNYTYFWGLLSEEKMLIQYSELSQKTVCYIKIILALHYILSFRSIMIFQYIRHLVIKPSNFWLEFQHLENPRPSTGLIKNLLKWLIRLWTPFRHHDAIKYLMGKQARLIIQDLQVNIVILCK